MVGINHLVADMGQVWWVLGEGLGLGGGTLKELGIEALITNQ